MVRILHLRITKIWLFFKLHSSALLHYTVPVYLFTSSQKKKSIELLKKIMIEKKETSTKNKSLERKLKKKKRKEKRGKIPVLQYTLLFII